MLFLGSFCPAGVLILYVPFSVHDSLLYIHDFCNDGGHEDYVKMSVILIKMISIMFIMLMVSMMCMIDVDILMKGVSMLSMKFFIMMSLMSIGIYMMPMMSMISMMITFKLGVVILYMRSM